MSEICIGTKTTKSVNRKYFQKGDAFEIYIATNTFRNAIVTEVTDTYVVLSYFSNDELQTLKLSVYDIECNQYKIIKLTPDYKEGKCVCKI